MVVCQAKLMMLTETMKNTIVVRQIHAERISSDNLRIRPFTPCQRFLEILHEKLVFAPDTLPGGGVRMTSRCQIIIRSSTEQKSPKIRTHLGGTPHPLPQMGLGSPWGIHCTPRNLHCGAQGVVTKQLGDTSMVGREKITSIHKCFFTGPQFFEHHEPSWANLNHY